MLDAGIDVRRSASPYSSLVLLVREILDAGMLGLVQVRTPLQFC